MDQDGDSSGVSELSPFRILQKSLVWSTWSTESSLIHYVYTGRRPKWLAGDEEPPKKVKEEEPDELFKDEKGLEIRNFVLNIAESMIFGG